MPGPYILDGLTGLLNPRGPQISRPHTPAILGLDFAGAAAGWTFGISSSAIVEAGSSGAFTAHADWTPSASGWTRTANGGVGGEMTRPPGSGPGGGTASMIAWVNAPPSSSATGLVLGWYDTAGAPFSSDRLSLAWTSGRLTQARRRYGGGNTSVSAVTAASGELVIGFSQATNAVNIYVNGAQVNSGTLQAEVQTGAMVGIGFNLPLGFTIRQVAMFQTFQPGTWHAAQAQRCGVAV